MGVLLTTSRKPSNRTRTFSKEFSRFLPDGVYVSRGKLSIEGVIEKARDLGKQRVAVIFERFGNPSKILFISVTEDSWDRLSTLLLRGVSLSRESVNKKRFSDQVFDLSLRGPKELRSTVVDLFGKESFTRDSDMFLVIKPSKGPSGEGKTSTWTFEFNGVEAGPRLNVSKIE
ncbi:MAG: hypothetical protein GOV15_04395 [Candidatus Diapherotrites archaeon]|nr:hypothetical protein [Candidatus Diapherotrites archaeon]